MTLDNRIRLTRTGRYKVRLHAEERELLLSLVTQLREMLAIGEPDLTRRLFPTAYPSDEAKELDYRELVGDDLLRKRLADLDSVEETLNSPDISESELQSWMAAINDLRLVLGTRLDVSEDTEPQGLDPADPDTPLHAAYYFLSYLLEHIVEVFQRQL